MFKMIPVEFSDIAVGDRIAFVYNNGPSGTTLRVMDVEEIIDGRNWELVGKSYTSPDETGAPTRCRASWRYLVRGRTDGCGCFKLIMPTEQKKPKAPPKKAEKTPKSGATKPKVARKRKAALDQES